MGCGKSTIAKYLSHILEMEDLETDDFIVKREDMTINEIFQRKGEEYFRKCETEVYYEAMAKSSINLVRGIRFADCRIISIRNQIYGRSEPNSKQNF